ncbi:hypothetical protein AAMO2058_000938500 [Amorphochlora amoebiformis]
MLSRSETIYSTVHYGMSAVSIGVEGINKTLQVVKTGSKVALKSTRHVVGQAHKMLSDMRMPYSEHYKEKEKRQMRLVHDRCKATIGHIPELLLMDEKFTKPKAQVQANDLNSTTWEGKLNSVSSSSILRDNCCAIINHTCKYQFHRQERREGCGYPNDPTNLVLIELRHWICDRLAREHKYTREFLEETKARLCYVQHLLGKGIFPSGRTSQITMRHTLFMVGMQLEECIKKIRRRLDSSTTHELICNLTKSLKSVVTPTIRYLWISWRNTKEEEATIPCTIPEFRAWCRAREAMGTSDSACLLLRDVLLSPGIFALYPDLGGEPRTTTSFLISNNSSKLQEGRHSTTREEKSSQEDKDWIDVEEFTVPRPGSLDDGREYFKLPRLARGVLSHFLSKRGALDAYAELHEKLKVLGELILALKSAESPSAQGGQILLVHAVGGVLNELLREIEGALNEMSQLVGKPRRMYVRASNNIFNTSSSYKPRLR